CEEGGSSFARKTPGVEMARAAVPRVQAGPGSPRQQAQPLEKQRPAPWPGLRSEEKKKVNCKPKNQDEQEIPFRLQEIMRSRQEMKNPISNKKRKKAAQVTFRKTLEKEAKGAEPDIAVPKFKQRKGKAQHLLFLSKNQAIRQPEVQAAPKEKSEQKKAKKKRKRQQTGWSRSCSETRLSCSPQTRTSLAGDRPGGVSQPLTACLARQRIVGEEGERAVQAYRVLKRPRRWLHGEQPHLTSRKKPEPQL
uniref:Coiled-coil domain containing 137 n=1 Tax=Nomascus leucogenys TaxID=61853 RepID=A0A2I3HVH1_NOMLE